MIRAAKVVVCLWRGDAKGIDGCQGRVKEAERASWQGGLKLVMPSGATLYCLCFCPYCSFEHFSSPTSIENALCCLEWRFLELSSAVLSFPPASSLGNTYLLSLRPRKTLFCRSCLQGAFYCLMLSSQYLLGGGGSRDSKLCIACQRARIRGSGLSNQVRREFALGSSVEVDWSLSQRGNRLG